MGRKADSNNVGFFYGADYDADAVRGPSGGAFRSGNIAPFPRMRASSPVLSAVYFGSEFMQPHWDLPWRRVVRSANVYSQQR